MTENERKQLIEQLANDDNPDILGMGIVTVHKECGIFSFNIKEACEDPQDLMDVMACVFKEAAAKTRKSTEEKTGTVH